MLRERSVPVISSQSLYLGTRSFDRVTLIRLVDACHYSVPEVQGETYSRNSGGGAHFMVRTSQPHVFSGRRCSWAGCRLQASQRARLLTVKARMSRSGNVISPLAMKEKIGLDASALLLARACSPGCRLRESLRRYNATGDIG